MGLAYVKKLLLLALVFDAGDGGNDDKDCPMAV
jgi:hypothetical protein